ncbi:MAG: hypothetical protein OIF50_04440 [Flavobacteriaceae bacterium]|nr:hypothetical protein [Flavobacteriaceae bacterium]
MSLIKRFGYYFFGFAIGLIFLAFFLKGKRTSCAYGPNARVLKNINLKKVNFSAFEKDSVNISKIMKHGDVIFSKSNTKLDSCKSYYINGKKELENHFITIKNCDSLVTITNYGKE